MCMKNLLIIGFVWPEPTSTAAGSRMLQIIKIFIEENYNIIFTSTAAKNTNSFDLESLGIKSKIIEINNSSFDKLLLEIDPSIVLFDRYLTEEQFGWRVQNICPNTLRILDTEDLHFLRYARLQSLKKNIDDYTSFLINDITLREIASIYRCDLTLIISKYEMNVLIEKFKVDKSILNYLPFLIDSNVKNKTLYSPSFKERRNFMTIGNFKHEPNYQAVLHLKKYIWPIIHKELPKVEMHVYGAYASEKIYQLENTKENFYIKGRIENTKVAFENAKVCLAPIKFGAGLKGKLFDAMTYGTPSVTTSIGAESMHDDLPWNGYIEDDDIKFAKKAIELYNNEDIWNESKKNGVKILSECFSKEKYKKILITEIECLFENLKTHRNNNFIGNMLMHHTLKSTKYMSKWIEEKNKK